MSNETETTGLIDGHVHVASTEFIPMSFIESSLANVVNALASQGVLPNRMQLLDLYLAKLQDGDCEQLLGEMDDAGIDKSVLLIPDFTYALRDAPLTIAETFDRHQAILDRHPDRFLVFGGVDPRWGEDGQRLFERSITEFGYHGLKLYPPCGYSPSDRMLYPFYEICAEHRLPVLTHVGPTAPILAFDTARPHLVDQAARDFPTVNFILAHGSNVHVEECAMMCKYRPNVYLDVSAFQANPVGNLAAIFAKGINHKIIFGTDWPLFRSQGHQADFVASLRSVEGPLKQLSSRQQRSFFRHTIAGLVKLPMAVR